MAYQAGADREVELNMARWYISFATSTGTGGFRGATVVEADDEKSALAAATLRGLNPGGEAAILFVPPESWDAPGLAAMLNRLVGREEMFAMGAVRRADVPQKMRNRFDREATFVCSCCNPPRVH
jgi:hypothetical protein